MVLPNLFLFIKKMIQGLLRKFFGSRNDRLVRQYVQKVGAINAFEAQMEALSDAALQGKTQEFRDRLSKGETLDNLLPEAFAVVREAGKRVHGMRHFDMQMIGGMVLHYGKIAEMRTGEGKTLTATLPVYLNALSGKGVHVVTVNDYLASRDADWMGRIYKFLGLTVGVNLSQMSARGRSRRLMPLTLRTVPITNSALTTCATTWCSRRKSACNAV